MNTLVGAVLLTRTGGILGPIASILGWVMDRLFAFTGLFGIENIGLCIILFTAVVKLLMLPLTIKQQKSSKLMAVMQPEIQAIQKKYKGKENDQKAMMMQTETKAVYEKYGTSMTGGCLPLLIQMPIIFALYRVIYNIPAYVNTVRAYYEAVIANLGSGFVENATFQALAEAQKMPVANFDYANNASSVIDLLYKFTSQQWDQLISAFPAVGEAVTESGTHVVDAIANMQNFFGLNLAYTPLQVISNFFGGVGGISVLTMIAALCIPLLAGGSQWFSTKLMTANSPTANQKNGEDPSANMMKSMNIMMPLMSVFFCFTFASGIGIYWVAQSVFTIIQQVFINAHLKKVDIDDLVQKNVEKANKKRAKKGLPPTKVGNVDEMMKKLQEKEDREETKRMEKIAKSKAQVEESNRYYNADAKPGSLAAKANMVAKYNEKHEKGGKK